MTPWIFDAAQPPQRPNLGEAQLRIVLTAGRLKHAALTQRRSRHKLDAQNDENRNRPLPVTRRRTVPGRQTRVVSLERRAINASHFVSSENGTSTSRRKEPDSFHYFREIEQEIQPWNHSLGRPVGLRAVYENDEWN